MRGIAERNGITDGLITVLSTLEPTGSFDVRWDARQKRLAAVRRQRRCLHYYLFASSASCTSDLALGDRPLSVASRWASRRARERPST